MDQAKLKIGLDNSTAIACESCNNPTFKEVTYLRRISKLLTGAPEDMIVPVPAFACAKCDHVNDQFQLKEPQKI